jgi:hypothetical protein
MQNFDPVKLGNDVADLLKRLDNLEQAIFGKEDVKTNDIVSALRDAAGIVTEFVPKLEWIESVLRDIAPLVPVLQEQFRGQVAGTGATEKSGVPAPDLNQQVL